MIRSLFGRAVASVLITTLAISVSACSQDSESETNAGPAILPPASLPAAAHSQVSDSPETQISGPILDLATRPLLQTAHPAVADARTTSDGVVLNFINADVSEVLRTVLGEILQVGYALHPEVKGRITFQTSAPLARNAVLPMLERVLETNDIALLASNGIYRAVPLALAIRNGSGRISLNASGNVPQPGHGLEIIPLCFAAARQLRSVLEPFVPAGGVLQVDEARNVLLVSGTGPQIASFVRLVSVFDVDWLAGMSFGLFPLEQGTASSVARDLAQVFDAAGDGALAGLVRIVPVDRINAILLASKQPSYITRAQTWIERLDKGWDESTPRIYVYNVQNSRAGDLANVLDKVFTGSVVSGAEMRTMPGSEPAWVGGTGLGSTSPGPVIGSRSTDSSPRAATPAGPRTGPSAPSATRPGSDAVSRMSAISPAAGGEGGIQAARIVADEKNNALVVYARPREYRMIEAAIRRLDVLPLQILIEATIAEVTLNDTLRYGLQWFFKSKASSATLSRFTDGSVSQVFPGFNYLMAATNTRVVLDALSAVTDVQVISAPQLMVLDHETAMLQVGNEVPIAVQQARSVSDENAPLVNTIELRNTGVILRVTPRVNSSGMATLEVEQEVSEVTATTTSDIDSPTIQQRRVRSVVAVGDGDTIALGGLIRENRTNSKAGLPILSEIPVLNFFTSTKSNSVERTELLILLTPRIVRNPDDARAVTEELRQRLNSVNINVKKMR